MGSSLLRILELSCTLPLLCLSPAPEKGLVGLTASYHIPGDEIDWNLLLCVKCSIGQSNGLQEVRKSAFLP